MVRDFPKLSSADAPTSDEQKERYAVAKAIEATRQHPQGHERLALIRAVYWEKPARILQEAAFDLHISEITAKRWHGDFIRLVGKYRGFDVADRV